MPWKERSVMDERLRFVARLLDGEAMSEVCRAIGGGFDVCINPSDGGPRVRTHLPPAASQSRT